MNYAEIEKYFDVCRDYWVRNGDSKGVATSKAFWWDCVEVWNSDNSWNEDKRKFAKVWRGYVQGSPVPDAKFVEMGAV